MKSFIEEVKALQGPENTEAVEAVAQFLENTYQELPAIKTLEAALKHTGHFHF